VFCFSLTTHTRFCFGMRCAVLQPSAIRDGFADESAGHFWLATNLPPYYLYFALSTTGGFANCNRNSSGDPSVHTVFLFTNKACGESLLKCSARRTSKMIFSFHPAARQIDLTVTGLSNKKAAKDRDRRRERRYSDTAMACSHQSRRRYTNATL